MMIGAKVKDFVFWKNSTRDMCKYSKSQFATVYINMVCVILLCCAHKHPLLTPYNINGGGGGGNAHGWNTNNKNHALFIHCSLFFSINLSLPSPLHSSALWHYSDRCS